VRILGADLARQDPVKATGRWTVVALDETRTVASVRHPASLPELVADVGDLTGGETFLLGVDIPVVGPPKPGRSGRSVDSLVRRRFGLRISPGGRAAARATWSDLTGENLLASLAGAGHACLTYPDRGLRTSGLAEIHPVLVLKALLWQGSALAGSGTAPSRDAWFRAYDVPAFRDLTGRGRPGWAERAAAADVTLRALGTVDGFDLQPVHEALQVVESDTDMDRAVSILDACLIAGTGARYLEAPETCVFVGERENGYTILPADGYIRRLVLTDAKPERGRLFPHASLRERLAEMADVRSLDLLAVRGKPQRLQAVFREPPLYEFDNLDEMLWWKHCRHLAGPALPTEGLQELEVKLGDGAAPEGKPLRLSRSRHETLSFRFDPPAAWRARLATRDGKVYPFRVLRATYETLPPS
jgi:predicted RNase H-like nuclease